MTSKHELHHPAGKLRQNDFYGGSETQNTRWVLELLEHKKNGYFIDIGCNDPVRSNNTFILEKKYAWEGIVVEPNAMHFGNILHMRTCEKILGRPIFEHDDTVDFMIIKDDRLHGYSGIKETLNPNLKFNFESSDQTIMFDGVSRQTKSKIVKLQAMSPNTLVKEYSVPKVFDYLKIDAEGAEINIIKNWPWDKAQPTLVSMEADPTQYYKFHQNVAKIVIEYMKKVNYNQVQNPYCKVDYEYFFLKSAD